MVKGLELFRSFFKEYTSSYILIGGTACDEHMSEAGLVFRATKDLDIIIVVEALNADFVAHFWEFIKCGSYEHKQISEGRSKHYRFLKPANEEYPLQVELFARNPDILKLPESAHLTPIPMDEDLTSLSVILMNDDYYNFAITTSEIVDNLHRSTVESLICLKAKAFLELKVRKEEGEEIDSKHIRKHKNDVIRLAVLLTEDDSIGLPDSIALDMREFVSVLENEPPDYRAIAKTMGLLRLDPEEVINQINRTFNL